LSPIEKVQEAFIRKNQLSLRSGATRLNWDKIIAALWEIVRMERHRRLELSLAGVGWDSAVALLKSMQLSPVKVPIRKQEQKVKEMIKLECGRPVVGKVTSAVPAYGRVFLDIGWRRPAVVVINQWTPRLRALRRDDRCMVWVTGLQTAKSGHQLVLASLSPPISVEYELELPPLSFTSTNNISPSEHQLGEKKTETKGLDATDIDGIRSPSIELESLLDELLHGEEFKQGGEEECDPHAGLEETRIRLGLDYACISAKRKVLTIRGASPAVLAALHWLRRVMGRWAAHSHDERTLSGLGYHATREVDVPVPDPQEQHARVCHPYHWVETYYKSRVTMMPCSAMGPSMNSTTGKPFLVQKYCMTGEDDKVIDEAVELLLSTMKEAPQEGFDELASMEVTALFPQEPTDDLAALQVTALFPRNES